MTDTNSSSNKEISSNITSLIAPEAIDSSKILQLFNDHFEATLSDILKSSELLKLTENNSDKLLTHLKSLDFVEFIGESKIKLNINSNLTVFSLVNIPTTWQSKDIIQKFKILKDNESKIIRLYKKSLFWNIAIDNSSIIESLEKELNSNVFTELDNNKVKYDKLDNKEIHNKLVKVINQNAYTKEASGLKSNHGNSNYDSTSKLSWRKKSNDTTDDFRRGSNFNKNSGTFQRSAIPQGTMRDRYNSDGQNVNFRPTKRSEEIEIDLSKIHYSLKIKHKYNNADILLFYDKYRINKIFDTKPEFTNFIEEVCSNEKRRDFNFLKRERSLTYSLPNNKFDNVKMNLDAPAFLPNRNPLSGGARLSGIQLNK